MKVGDKVVALISEEIIDKIVKGEVYKIKRSFMWDGYGLVIVLEGQSDTGWLVNDNGRIYFKELEPQKSQSTSASRSLVKTLHVEKIGTKKDKYLEEERELQLNAKF